MEEQYRLSSLVYYRNLGLRQHHQAGYRRGSEKPPAGTATKRRLRYTRTGRTWAGIYYNLLLIAIWMLIYIVYHYVERGPKELDRLRLEIDRKKNSN